MQGKIQQFKPLKGYGFILHGFKTRIFFHVTNWNSDVQPRVGMPVQFDTAPSGKPGLPDKAVNVVPLESVGAESGKAGA